jgi:hypothetical protein
MKVKLHWTRLDDGEHHLWEACPAIYTYIYRREILYVGKVDGSSTVRSRWNAADKDNLFEFLEKQGIEQHRLWVHVGEFEYDGRLTRQVVADVESLLIAGLRPRGNIASMRSRIARPGLNVRCLGVDWPHTSNRFIDA